MNYNVEIAELYKSLGLESGVRNLTDDEKAKQSDYDDLKTSIENRNDDTLLDRSYILANNSIII